MRPTQIYGAHFGKGHIMKRIISLTIAAVACSAGAAWSQDAVQAPQAIESAGEQLTVAQASSRTEGGSMPREAASTQSPHERSFYDTMGLSADGPFPSRGGPVDD